LAGVGLAVPPVPCANAAPAQSDVTIANTPANRTIDSSNDTKSKEEITQTWR
jgi:hypothetical protein